MSIVQISKIQVRSGNLDDLPQLSVGEFGWASDAKRLFIGNDPNVLGPQPDNTEILTQYSPISPGGLTDTYDFGVIGQTVLNPIQLTLQMLPFDFGSPVLSNFGNFNQFSNPTSVMLDLGTF